VKDGDFDRLRIPMDNGSGGPAVTEMDVEPDADDDDPVGEAQRLGFASSPAQLAAGSAVIAGLILVGLAALRRRRGRGSDRNGAA
jgi:hypothetical protein